MTICAAPSGRTQKAARPGVIWRQCKNGWRKSPEELETDVNRRNMLYGCTPLVAGLAGASVAWWKFRPHDVAGASASGQPDAASQAFWALNFDTPDGASLAMTDF